MGRKLAIALLVAFMAGTAGARTLPPDAGDLPSEMEALRSFRLAESRALAASMGRALARFPAAHQAVDVLHYDLDLSLDPYSRRIGGTVTATLQATSACDSLTFLLHRALDLSSVQLDGGQTTVKRKGDKIVLHPSAPLSPGSIHTVAITYSGTPATGGNLGGGMLFSEHDGVPAATTLSEPYESFTWWPCIDDVSDKVLADIRLTVPASMAGVSNGTLEEVRANSDGTSTYHWTEGYPIANYLIAANVTNYAAFSQAYTSLDGLVTMPVDHFVYPEDLARAQINFTRVPEMVAYYAGLCGEYPFLSEKYGMVAFPWGGGMEHQTITSMGDAFVGGSGSYNGIYAHELAHQWWGDEVTCGTWNDIWLNEGFATYFEALWLARQYGLSEGEVMAWYDDGQVNGYMGGAVYLKNPKDPFADTGAIYDKGGWVLHMLRRVMGDGPFFEALRAYRSAHAYGNATTEDLRAACEQVYGSSLDWFFQQWVYTPKRPVYEVSFAQAGSTVSVTLRQRQTHKIKHRTSQRNVYIMPVDLTLHFEGGGDVTQTVWNDARSQTFTFSESRPVVAVGLDEANWILKVAR